MIALTGGVIQSSGGVGVPNGSIEFRLNVDAAVIAAPNGFVSSEVPIVFQFDANGNIEAGAEIWSNEELNPQTVDGLGTSAGAGHQYGPHLHRGGNHRLVAGGQ